MLRMLEPRRRYNLGAYASLSNPQSLAMQKGMDGRPCNIDRPRKLHLHLSKPQHHQFGMLLFLDSKKALVLLQEALELSRELAWELLGHRYNLRVSVAVYIPRSQGTQTGKDDHPCNIDRPRNDDRPRTSQRHQSCMLVA